MRRTLALLGAAALAVAGIAGPANASDINAQGDIRFANTELNGTGVHPGTSSNPTEAWYELETISGANEPLQGLTVIGCVAADSSPIAFVQQYGPVFVPANLVHTTSDPEASVTGDTVWDMSASGELDSSTFALRLVEDFQGPDEIVIDSTSNGNPNGTCLAALPPL